MTERGSHIEPAQGKLGVLLVGLGAVSTTLIAGVEAVNQGLDVPIVGTVTQRGRIRLGKRTEERNPLIKDFVPLANLPDLRFGAWDIIPDNAYEQALHAEVLKSGLIDQLRPGLSKVKPMTGVFDQDYVKRLRGVYVKQGRDKMDLAEQVMADMQRFKRVEGCDRMVMVYIASTERFIQEGEEHQDLVRFRQALGDSSPNISPSMIYAYAALESGVPFINATPGLTADIPAMRELAQENEVPVAGKDLKTGQTLLKTILAPGLRARMLGVDGWVSFNVLGNKDGVVLADPGSLESKVVSKGSVLEDLLPADLYPDLYGGLQHLVDIQYYGPAGDDKEAWDRVDLRGWMGERMSLRLNFQCKDSILAAPVVLDLALFMDLAQRSGMRGTQEWLSFFFKSPMTAPNLRPEHNFFNQIMKMENRLRHLKGEELISHLGLEYYG